MRKDSVNWKTNRDRNAFFEVLTRVTYPISYDVFDIQKIVNKEDTECKECGGNADFRVVKRQGKPFTVYRCMGCLEEELNKWMEEQLDNLKQELTRYNVAEEL